MPKTQLKDSIGPKGGAKSIRLRFAKTYRLCYSARPIGASGVYWPTWIEVKAKSILKARSLGMVKIRKTHDVFSFMTYTVKA